MRALAMMLPGNQEVRAKGLHTLPTRSWIMNRPTLVPASTVVRMNSASNMMAKWYQKACIATPPKMVEKIWDIPSANVGAPAGPGDYALLADVVGGVLERLRGDAEAEAVDGLRGRLHGVADDARR